MTFSQFCTGCASLSVPLLYETRLSAPKAAIGFEPCQGWGRAFESPRPLQFFQDFRDFTAFGPTLRVTDGDTASLSLLAFLPLVDNDIPVPIVLWSAFAFCGISAGWA